MRYEVTGRDEFGKPSNFIMDVGPYVPDLYFWLGAEADTTWQSVRDIVLAKPQFMHEYGPLTYDHVVHTPDGRPFFYLAPGIIDWRRSFGGS